MMIERHWGAVFLAVTLLCTVLPARAQVGALPPEAAAAFRLNGPVLNAEVTRVTIAALAPLQELGAPPGSTETLNVRYGDDPRQRLDVYVPARAAGDAVGLPVLIFVHGGGFVTGNKRRDGAFFYQNVGYAAARAGVIGVVMTYRLAPQFVFPSGAQDVAAAVAWVRANIPAQGGDVRRITLMGHSAGAAHVADFATRPDLYSPDGLGVSGLILVSGIYDPPTMTDSPTLAQYYSADAGLQRARSGMPGLVRSRLPMLVSVAEYDPPGFVAQGEALHAALCARSVEPCPPIYRLAGHNHVSEVMAIGTADRAFSDTIMAFTHDPR